MEIIKKVLIVTKIFISGLVQSQGVENLKVQLSGGDIILHFDLASPSSQGFFEIEVFSSHDNFNAPLHHVSGDVGFEIRPGQSKRITWEVKEGIGNYTGRLSLEIQSRFYIPFVTILTPTENQLLRRVKNTT